MTPRLVITGTRHGRPDVWDALDAWVQAFGAPSMLVLGDAPGGDAPGVDTQAQGWANHYAYHQRPDWGFPAKVVRVDRGRYSSSTAFRKRDEAMIAWTEPGDHLLAFPHPVRSPGTWLTFGLGRKAGLLCAVVDPCESWLRKLRLAHELHPRWAA